jgi:colanic acid/amylovoran biosynthesis glycosyltransferase
MGSRHLGYVLKRFPRISETFVASEIIELERQGERVSIFAIKRPEEPFEHAFLAGLQAPITYLPHPPWRHPVRVAIAAVRALRADRRGWLRAARLSLWPPRRVGLRVLLQAGVLRDEMKRAGVTHAHAHFASEAAQLANLAWQMGGPSYSVTAHAKDIYHEAVAVDHLRNKLAAATFVATVSEANRAYLASVLPPSAPLHVIHNAVDARRVTISRERTPEPGLVLAVARLIEKKGLHDLIRACGALRRDGVAARLEIVGDGELRGSLEAEAVRVGADVTFHGALPHERVMALFERAAAFSLPCVVASSGDRDAMPTSVLEAMAAGVPVVTTAVNGLSELVIDGETGLVVPEHDPEALATALRRILTEPALGRRLALAARRRVEDEFALDRSVSDLRARFPAAA